MEVIPHKHQGVTSAVLSEYNLALKSPNSQNLHNLKSSQTTAIDDTGGGAMTSSSEGVKNGKVQWGQGARAVIAQQQQQQHMGPHHLHSRTETPPLQRAQQRVPTNMS
ncbi:hypothetical protein FGO68_gene3383 [Halteria grandinella]|uniref:Uncharacterized protein n=1 Tax=Halteria grandinella TaxID=5974 RepID=A0A8J8SVH1_HALGN|nr:hypothetical protein FGO68_gene3383 [Halteria grandinella]